MNTARTYNGGRIIVAVGDITEFDGDAIVNAANSSLLGGGGVDGAIHRAAGPELLAECRALRAGHLDKGLPPGRAVATGSGRLLVKGVIHTVGPICRDAGAVVGDDKAAILASAYSESLALANERGWRSVAFPAISTGVYGYPKREAARVAFKAVTSYLAANALPATVWLVFYSPGDAEPFMAAIDDGSAGDSGRR
ncbi:MAG: O-acetyl-ADP-ribose deacetylase [Spirochaetae bacterium HGW-Spirochaetae-7]|nr:MAG: O-acetyl-ADP-ribose deacetylase [Spirochaetae bacterium HGW-Spirochaetae-7]